MNGRAAFREAARPSTFWSRPVGHRSYFVRSMRHHTKDDGDIGVACVVADLTLHGLSVGTLLSEHRPFDLVVVSPTYELCRLSVKFRRAKRGQIAVSLRSMWNDRSGTHIVKHDKTSYDAVAIYCPDTHECYYAGRTRSPDRR